MTNIESEIAPTLTLSQAIVFTSCTQTPTIFPTAYVGNTGFLGLNITITFNNGTGVGTMIQTLDFPNVTLTSFLPTQTVIIVCFRINVD